MMTIQQTVDIPADRRVVLDLPRSIPVGAQAIIEISISKAQNVVNTAVKSYRGALKGKGITIERFREIQREEKALEYELEKHRNNGTA